MENNNLYDTLFSSLLNHKWDIFIDLITKNINNIDINITDKKNNKMLFYAVVMNKPDIVKLLIDEGANIDITDNDKNSIAYYAIIFNYDEILDILLEANKTSIGMSLFHTYMDVNSNIVNSNNSNSNSNSNNNSKSKSLLTYAIDSNNEYALKAILLAGGDPNIKDEKGYNTLHYIIHTRNIDLIKVVIKYINNINATCNIGETALHIATNYQLEEVCTLLLSMKCDPDIQDIKYQFSVLHYSVSLGNHTITNLLLKYNANPNLQDIYGNTALHYAIAENSFACISTIVNYPYTHNTLNFNLWNNKNSIPCHLFFIEYSEDKIYYIEPFIDKSNFSIKDNNGNNLLHYLVIFDIWKDYKKYILKKKLDLYSKNKEGKCVLDYIKKNDCDEFMDLVTQSYINRLKKHRGQWITDNDQICSLVWNTPELKNYIPKRKLDKTFDNFKTFDQKTFDDKCFNYVKNNIIKLWKNNDVCHDNGIRSNKCIISFENNSVNVCTFTGSTLDILCGLIYILYKHPFSCGISSKNIVNNKELCDFYKIHSMSLDNYQCEFLNFEILWINYKLYIIESFYDMFKKCIASGKRFIVIPLGIEVKNNNHANYIIYDLHTQEIERFEPHGNYPHGLYYNPKLLDSILKDRFIMFNSKIKYITPSEYLPKIGFQLFENYENNKKIGDPPGFCALWSVWYVDMRLSYPNIERKILVKNLIKTIHNKYKSFKDIIRNYSTNITKIRDDVLSIANIDINDWMNDNYNEIQYKKILNKLNEKLVNIT